MTEVELVDVGPRDGFQAIKPFIPTDTKIQLILALHAAGLRRLREPLRAAADGGRRRDPRRHRGPAGS